MVVRSINLSIVPFVISVAKENDTDVFEITTLNYLLYLVKIKEK